MSSPDTTDLPPGFRILNDGPGREVLVDDRTDDAAPVRRCCRHASNDYDCWTSRYGVRVRSNIEIDGGPCQCVCHEELEDDEW